MKFHLLFALLFLSQEILAKDQNYLGSDRADVEEALRLYTEKQLVDMRKNQREQLSPTDDQNKLEEEEPSKSWNDDISQMMKSEVENDDKPIPTPSPIPWSQSLEIGEIPLPKKSDWQQAGMTDFSRKEKRSSPGEIVTIPTGSFIMADLLTGVDAPSQSSIPALIRTRFGFVSPNDGFVDLSGCHAIAQASGDLSTERVKFKTITLSCLSPKGIPYSQDFTAYATGIDDSFGVSGQLRSRQGRVAMMAFLNGIVEGATKLVSQTSSAVVAPLTALGNEGSSSAATEVVRWYLDHAKELVPTIEVKAGAEIRLVLLEPLTLPKSFFNNFQNKELNHEQTDLVF